MKKSLIALAVMAAAGAASAQSSVTLFGIVDLAVKHVRGDGNGKQTQLARDGYNSSRLGFRGTEDLGGGMSASFWLEAGINPDTGNGDSSNINNQSTGGLVVAGAPAAGATARLGGTQGLTFNRRSTVSLAGGWGELRLGRDYAPHFWNWTIFDPFGTQGVGSATNLISGAGLGTTAIAGGGGTNLPTLVRASNSIGYFLPANLGGFYGQVMYAFGENASTCTVATASGSCPGAEDDGRHVGARLGFGSGPFNIALGYGRTEYAATSPQGGDYRVWNLGGQWDFGVAKLLGQYSRDEIESATNPHQRSYLIGALVPVGAGEIRVSFVNTKTTNAANGSGARQLALGYVHNLSKRTAVYATYARLQNRGDGTLYHNGRPVTDLGGDSDGVDIGLRHSF
jgi:predicted porin